MPATLVLMARPPRPGRTKTRLVPCLGPDGAARFARAALEDVAERLAAVPARRVVAWSESPAGGDPVSLPPGYEVALQGDGDLGTRMARLCAAHPGPTVIVGTDAPTLPVAGVTRALELLADGFSAVFQPALDGGYTLAGFAREPGALLQDIPWGTGRVLAVTLERATGFPGRVGILDPWYDVDVEEDLRMLRGHLSLLEGTAEFAPRTARFLDEVRPGDRS